MGLLMEAARQRILIGMPDVTRIRGQIERDDPAATDQLLPLVDNELRQRAAAKLAR